MKLPIIIPAAFMALAISGCGSSDDDDVMSGTGDTIGDTTDDTDGDSSGGGDSGTDEGATGGNDTGGSDTGGPGSASFFNDQSTFSFAESLGGRLSRLFSVGLGAFDDEDPSGKRFILATQNFTEECPGGGSIDLSQTTDDLTGELTAAGIEFENCVDGSETSDGGITISGSALSDNADSGTVSINIDNFSVTGADPVAMNGEINASTTLVGDETTATVNGSGLTLTAEGETITFSNYSVTAVSNDTTGAATLSASLTVNSSVDGTIAMNINPPLAAPDDSTDFPLTGTIVMTHSDGSSLTINADTGNPATFSYTVTENGATTSGTANWADTDIDL